MKRKYRNMTFTATVPGQGRWNGSRCDSKTPVGTPWAECPAITPATLVQRVTPADLPRPVRAAIAVIDVDNLVLGEERLVPDRALSAVEQVYRRLANTELTLAAVSRQVLEVLGAELYLRFPAWVWRLAHEGKDAADRQLIDFANTGRRQRPDAVVAVASGDHGFLELAFHGPMQVVVPDGLRVAKVLQPYLGRPRRASRDSWELAT